MEKTLVIIKPCALQRALAGEVLSRFEKKGLKIVALKMYRFTIESSMMAAPVILVALEGIDAVEVVREMTGSTSGRKALPGTVRGDYCMSHQENIIHASDSKENAEKELRRFFDEQDFFEYDTPLFPYLYAEDEI